MMVIATTPEECESWFAELVRARRLDDLVTLYEPGACVVERDGTIVRGHAGIRRTFARLTAVATTIDMQIVHVVESGGIAVVYNDWHLRTKSADGRAIETAGKALEVVRRQPDGRWLFAIDDPFGREREPIHHRTTGVQKR